VVLVFSGVIAAMAMVAVGGDNPAVLLVGLVCGVAAGTAWGVKNGFLVAKAKIPPLIVTLGTMGMSIGLALVVLEWKTECRIRESESEGNCRLVFRNPKLGSLLA
jgi:ribose/xylose/arabinose/galactoside ABC-type transport system permease subunit